MFYYIKYLSNCIDEPILMYITLFLFIILDGIKTSHNTTADDILELFVFADLSVYQQ